MSNVKNISDFLKKYGNQLSKEATDDLLGIKINYDYLEKIFEHNPCTISLVDENETYLKVNPQMQSMFKDSVLGKKVGDITKNDSISKVIQDMKIHGKDTGYSVLETIIDNEKKYFFIKVNAVGSKFLIIGSDITQMKNLEQEKEFNDKMIFLGEMTSFIIHEINNPLSTISMSNEMIQLVAPGEEVQKYTEQIEEMTNTIVKIIDSLKTFSRKNDNATNPIKLQSLYEKSRIILGSKIKKNGIKVTATNLTNVEIQGNELDFIQVLVNLISNAMDAVENLEEKWVNLVWEDNRIKIIDSGAGIPEEVTKQLFQKFYTSKGNNGTGIGLHLSQTLLNKWGYDIRYELTGNHTSFVLSKAD